MKFNFEKNLQHQKDAVDSTLSIFNGLEFVSDEGLQSPYRNPLFNSKGSIYRYRTNISQIQQKNEIDWQNFSERIQNDNSNVLDIMMETGTGKTYTYTQTIFELNKQLGVFKFVIVVPTLSIKAGTISFIKSDSAREHFRSIYGKEIELHIVESIKAKKGQKQGMPSWVNSFVGAANYEKNCIQVLLINMGMLNSPTMEKSFDQGLFDSYSIPFEAIASTAPFVIIDEPHKFDEKGKTFKNIERLEAQFILRYGATFKEYKNLIYQLRAVDAFNKNLVKGVIGHVTEFEEGKNALVRLMSTDGKEAKFELDEGRKKTSMTFARKDCLSRLHPAMEDLYVEALNKSKVVLSNGLELSIKDKFNPYSFAQSLQEMMIEKAVKNHFDLERELLTQEPRIKPLSLFFIDNIEEYRSQDGYLRNYLERLIQSELKQRLAKEENSFYKSYLEESLKDVSLCHGGYFSKDNSDKDEAVEQEVNEILHDKQTMLSLDNPRRFIFSKWTLREGWDNPNVFQICKLRSSGSEISKLQEVGRGLRLPVNEFGNRVKDRQFYLNYFVDFTESNFVDSLVQEVNEKSGGAISMEIEPPKLEDRIIRKICAIYHLEEDDLLEQLDEANIINRANKWKKEGGWQYIQRHFPKIFDGVTSNKIRKAESNVNKVTIRQDKYSELQALWEQLNEKVLLEYKFENEEKVEELFIQFLQSEQTNFHIEGLQERAYKMEFTKNRAITTSSISSSQEQVLAISTMKYSDFIKDLALALNLNMLTIHRAFVKSQININDYLNTATIRLLKQGFDKFLMYNAINQFGIGYKKVSNSVHPTKLTDSLGKPLSSINASDVGVTYTDELVAKNYLFNELFFDSDLEKENIITNVSEVVVFTKIPKNSIKIPVAGGYSYSPDFAYVLNFKNGAKKLHFIIETKNVDSNEELRKEEEQKIKHAEQLFADTIKITFKRQLKNKQIVDLIKEINGEGL